MSWWLFFPVLYAALAGNRTLAGSLSWDSVAPDFLLLLLPLLAFAEDGRRALWQALLVGLCLDLSGAGPLCMHGGIATLLVWGAGQCQSEEPGRRTVRRLLWGLPLMTAQLAAANVWQLLLTDTAINAERIAALEAVARTVVNTAAWTMVCGLALWIVGLVVRRLVPLPDVWRPPRRASASPFFLSR